MPKGVEVFVMGEIRSPSGSICELLVASTLGWPLLQALILTWFNTCWRAKQCLVLITHIMALHPPMQKVSFDAYTVLPFRVFPRQHFNFINSLELQGIWESIGVCVGNADTVMNLAKGIAYGTMNLWAVLKKARKLFFFFLPEFSLGLWKSDLWLLVLTSRVSFLNVFLSLWAFFHPCIHYITSFAAIGFTGVCWCPSHSIFKRRK